MGRRRVLRQPLLPCAASLALVGAPAAQSPEQRPWRLADTLGGPGWFKVSGEQRTRYETLDHEYRFRTTPASPPPGQGWADSQDVLALRTLLLLEAKGDTLGGAVELVDSRQYGGNDEGFVDATMANPLDVLQAYADLQLGGLAGGKHRLRVGRETIDLGSRRLVGRNGYRNTINSFHAVDWQWTGDAQSLRAFWSRPTERRPQSLDPLDSVPQQDRDLDVLRDNDHQWDTVSTEQQFLGLAYESKLDERTSYDVYLFSLRERGDRTRRRELWTPGLHIGRARAPGALHWEAELTGQFGHSKVNTSPSSQRLDHRAGFATAALGYTLDATWSPGLTASYAYATGDRDPNDDDNGRYDTLFGVRRLDYGPTGIFGAIARANLNSPELRFHLQPSQAIEIYLAVRGVWLAASRDAWTTSGLRDRTGQAGTHVGTQYELRLRWDVVPRSCQLDTGVAYLAEGDFQDLASLGQGQDSSYGYVQCTWSF